MGLLRENRLDAGVAFGGLAFGAVLTEVLYMLCPGPRVALAGGPITEKRREYEIIMT
jgi:hypothetical protein